MTKGGVEFGARGFASSRPVGGFGRVDETLEKQLQLAPQRETGMAVDADEPREVLIVVNDQPIDLPTILPATQPAGSGTTTAPAGPTTGPSGPPVGQRPSK